MQLINPKLYR